MGKLLKFPEVETYVQRDCQVCGFILSVATEALQLHAEWGNYDFLCWECLKWEAEQEDGICDGSCKEWGKN